MELNNLVICCNEIKNSFKKTPISYKNKYREFLILTEKKGGCYGIKYCPFCGKKFLKELSDLYAKELKKIFKNKRLVDIERMEDNEIPEEFRTDEWWIKRGL